MHLQKVAVITPGTFPIPSGSSSSVERVVEHVVSKAAQRIDARIYARLWSGQEEIDTVRGVSCVRIRASGARMYMQGVIRSMAQFMPDTIQIENRPRFVLPIKRSFPNAQIILNLHSVTFMSRKHIPLKLLRSSLRAADRIFVNSRYLYRKVAAVCPSCASRIVVNTLGVDQERFRSKWTEEGMQRSEAGKDMLGWADRKIILYVGRLIPLKGVHHLLKAIPRVIARQPKALFVIVGSAFYGSARRTVYVRKLERLGRAYPQHIRFVPYVSHEQIPDWYLLADVVVMPSVEKEAFGLVNVEAMASGVPVLATRVGGIQEVVADGITGVLVRPFRLNVRLANELNRLLDDDERRMRMGEAAVEHVRNHFTWDKTAERWANEIGAPAEQ